MKICKNSAVMAIVFAMTFSGVSANAQGQDYGGQEDPNKKIIKSGLLGAATGAIASGASGGSAGKGALIGAGTNVVGGALLDTLTGPSTPAPAAQPVYVQQAPVYTQQAPAYTQTSYPVQTRATYQPQPEPVYVQQQPVYYQQQAPQEDPNKKIIKSGLLGAATGAIASSASGGNAGKGALIGAGTNVIGGALLDGLLGGGSTQSRPQPVYVQQQPVYQQPQYAPQQPYYSSSQSSSSTYQNSANQPKKKIIRKYDKDGNVVSEEEVWE